MKRNTLKINVNNRSEFIQKALYWSNDFDCFSYFNPNNFSYPNNPFNHFLAAGIKQEVSISNSNVFESLESSVNVIDDYLIGHLSYDLKNQLEDLKSENTDCINAPLTHFYIPNTIIHFQDEHIEIETFNDPNNVFKEINEQPINPSKISPLEFYPVCSKKEYLKTVKTLKQHIIEGDIYEINYCHEYQADGKLDPVDTYLKLIYTSPSPFSALYKCEDIYTICGSPERFLKKEGNVITTQPIKGTAKRSNDPIEDEMLKNHLKSNEKELAENMMIVDLCRNDLAKSCLPGSVKVDEMFGVYSFPLWHQMISTVSGKLKSTTSSIQAIKNAFPMGSMTGAPKIKVMELSEKYEISRRGIYSGSIGYFLPNGDFDFNVIIRSINYNNKLSKCSFMVGGAITYDSIPEDEYNECLTKAKTLTSIFKINNEK